jgi:flagellar basal body-associated protein FliL
MGGSLWIMLGIVLFVFVGQAILWSWVLIQRKQKVPDVEIFKWREIYDFLREQINKFDSRRRNRSQF